MTTLYGISNCDTVKKARKWLDDAGVAYTFHDFRVYGLEEALVRAWIDALGWEAIVNKRSTTWRQLSDDVKSGMDDALAVREILGAPTLVKRPVLEMQNARHIGFREAQYVEIFGK